MEELAEVRRGKNPEAYTPDASDFFMSEMQRIKAFVKEIDRLENKVRPIPWGDIRKQLAGIKHAASEAMKHAKGAGT
jgi:hypothetical protein